MNGIIIGVLYMHSHQARNYSFYKFPALYLMWGSHFRHYYLLKICGTFIKYLVSNFLVTKQLVPLIDS